MTSEIQTSLIDHYGLTSFCPTLGIYEIPNRSMVIWLGDEAVSVQQVPTHELVAMRHCFDYEPTTLDDHSHLRAIINNLMNGFLIIMCCEYSDPRLCALLDEVIYG